MIIKIRRRQQLKDSSWLKKDENNFSSVCFQWRFTGKIKNKKLVSQNRIRKYICTNTFMLDTIGRNVTELDGRDI